MARWFDDAESTDPKDHWKTWTVDRKARSLKTYVSAGVCLLSAVVVLMQHGA